MFWRILSFLGLFMTAWLLPWWCALAVGVLYALWWSDAYELIVLGAAFDAYFGFVWPPFYTVLTIGAVVLTTWVKPKLMYYQEI